MKSLSLLLHVLWTEKIKCLGFRENWNRTMSVTRNQEKKAFLLWAHFVKDRCCLEKEIIQGTTLGSRHQEDQEHDITEWTGLKADLLLWSAKDRTRWQRIVHETATLGVRTVSLGWRKVVPSEINCALYSNAYQDSLKRAHLLHYVHKLDVQGTRHLPPPRRHMQQLHPGRGGCSRGQTSCVCAKRQTAVSRVSETSVSR